MKTVWEGEFASHSVFAWCLNPLAPGRLTLGELQPRKLSDASSHRSVSLEHGALSPAAKGRAELWKIQDLHPLLSEDKLNKSFPTMRLVFIPSFWQFYLRISTFVYKCQRAGAMESENLKRSENQQYLTEHLLGVRHDCWPVRTFVNSGNIRPILKVVRSNTVLHKSV